MMADSGDQTKGKGEGCDRQGGIRKGLNAAVDGRTWPRGRPVIHRGSVREM